MPLFIDNPMIELPIANCESAAFIGGSFNPIVISNFDNSPDVGAAVDMNGVHSAAIRRDMERDT